MASLWLDLRYALRLMLRAPGLTAVLVVTLALGVGATTTIFSVVHSVVLRPLPYRDPDRLMRLRDHIIGKSGLPELDLSVVQIDTLQRSCDTCVGVAAWRESSASLAGGDRPVRVRATYATHSLQPLLGVAPLLGRWFDAREDQPGDPEVIVLGYDLWQRAFAGDPKAVGRKLHLDAMPVTVIGVMPAGFRFPDRAELYVPSRLDFTRTAEGSFNYATIARLADRATPDAFNAELAARSRGWTEWLNRIAAKIGMSGLELRTSATLLQTDIVGNLATTLWLLQGAVLLVLLISIVNVANLLIARAETRTREVAVRHALGASRHRLVRQFVTESLLLGLVGGGLGILVAMWATSGVTALIPRNLPRAADIALDAPAVAFAVGCSIAAALVFGLAPILHARRTDLYGALKDGSQRITGSKARLRVRRALVISEIALAVVLVVGCATMVTSFLRLQAIDVGFAPDHLLTFGIELPPKTYPYPASGEFWRRLHERLQALPGVRGATVVENLPTSYATGLEAFSLPGRSSSDPGEPDWIVDFTQTFSDDSVDVLGAHLVRGRGFAATDHETAAPVAMINEAFAARFFHGRDPLGQQFTMVQANRITFTVVGVIADLRQDGVAATPRTELIVPLRQFPQLWDPPRLDALLHVAVRTTGDPESLIPAVQRLVGQIDPTLPVFDLKTMDDVLGEAVARPRFLMFLLTAFAALALVLAAVGIYGVMAHTVALRTHEIGLRVALGAAPAQVRAMVLRQAGGMVAIGVATGLAAAIALSLALGSALRGVFYRDAAIEPGLLAGVAVAIAATALLATWVPARRATRVQPTVALRSD